MELTELQKQLLHMQGVSVSEASPAKNGNPSQHGLKAKDRRAQQQAESLAKKSEEPTERPPRNGIRPIGNRRVMQ